MATHPTDWQRAGILSATILVATCAPPIVMTITEAVCFCIDHYVRHYPKSFFYSLWPGDLPTILLTFMFSFLPGGLLAAVLLSGLYQHVHTSFRGYLVGAFILALFVWVVVEAFMPLILKIAVDPLYLTVTIGSYTLFGSIAMFSLSKRLERRYEAATDTETGSIPD